MIESGADGDRSEAIVRLLLDGTGSWRPARASARCTRWTRRCAAALADAYPALAGIRLVDYKVRILDGRDASRAVTRVMLTSADAEGEWTTVGVSSDIVTASWEALADGVQLRAAPRRGRAAGRRRGPRPRFRNPLIITSAYRRGLIVYAGPAASPSGPA